ncbi:MAG: hypothetical protein PWP34_2200 [Desulfuromonadales bacterium]|nr:hypothetical protein [Desulfuromonadales bacterium]
MSVNSYLSSVSNAAIVRDAERESIKRSISTLKTRLNLHFYGQLSNHFIFGSYSRGTILPRNMDEKSDVDYMIIFKDSSNKPQTYLSQLRKFVEKYYSRSEIYQSNPTIVLSLKNIRFELVPAIDGLWTGLQIPAKASDYQDWINTDPRDLNESLTQVNQSNNNLIKPLVRVFKYWNACSSYPFESYSLEKEIVHSGFAFRSLFGGQLKNYFYDFVGEISVGYFAAQWRKNAVERLKQIAAEAKSLEDQNYPYLAQAEIEKLLPAWG